MQYIQYVDENKSHIRSLEILTAARHKESSDSDGLNEYAAVSEERILVCWLVKNSQ